MSAILSPSGRGVVALIGVNPSTADATINDHTIRKDMGFARKHGWQRIIKGNVFAYRATDVNQLARVGDPVGPENDKHLAQIIRDADLLIPCWGRIDKVPAALRSDFSDVLEMLRASGKQVMTFGLTAGGDPRHP